VGQDVLRRFPDWPKRLHEAVEAARARPFQWGSHDCLLFAADVVRSMTGKDLAAHGRGQYDSDVSALRLIHNYGGMVPLVSKALGDPVPVLRAHRGDVVMYRSELGPSLGVCLGAQCAFTGPTGLVFKQRKECELAWRV
jgi:hypothetical protein